MIKEDMLIAIFCDIDDFCKQFEPKWKEIHPEYPNGPLVEKRDRPCNLSLSEIMTRVVYFHVTRFRTFKDYYKFYVLHNMKKYFPKLVSYSRFVNMVKICAFPLFIFSQGCLGQCTGLSFIDSTILTVCHARRITSHKVFRKLAKKSKISMGWFLGFKLHLIINDKGEILTYMLTSGNMDDRSPVEYLSKDLFGKMFGDRGLEIITKLRSNMKNKLMSLVDKFLLRKRGMIESVHNKLKNSCQIEHHRHRSPWNFLVNLISGLIAYAYDPEKPRLEVTKEEQALLLAA